MAFTICSTSASSSFAHFAEMAEIEPETIRMLQVSLFVQHDCQELLEAHGEAGVLQYDYLQS